MRLFVAMRSRFAGIRRHAIEQGRAPDPCSGAGLDTFAYRLEPRDGLRVFELDHPATQRDKRRRLEAAGVTEPPYVAYVAHDFEHGSVREALEAAGLDTRQRTFVMWLGVTPYLTDTPSTQRSASWRAFPAEWGSCSTTPTRRTRSKSRMRAIFITRWRSRWRRAASRSAAIPTRSNCTRAQERSAMSTSRI